MKAEHLSNDARVRALYGVASALESQHAASCTACRAELAEMEQRRAGAAALGELPESFWRRQRAAALAQQPQPATRLRWAVSLAAVVALAALLIQQRPEPSAYNAADDQLLREVSLLVNRFEPRALAPATLLLPEEIKEVLRP